MGKNVLGIDIGNYSLKAAEWKGGGLKDFDSFDMPGNLVRGEEIIAFEALGDFLHDAVRKRFKTGYPGFTVFHQKAETSRYDRAAA